MIGQELEVSLHMAFVEARQARHEFITVEHLLLALLDNPSAAEVLRTCACNIEDLRKSLQTFVSDKTPVLPPSSATDVQPTLAFQRLVQRATNGKNEVSGADVLAAIFGEKDSHAVYYLHQQGVTKADVVNHMSCDITKVPQSRGMVGQELEESLYKAFVEARQARHEFMTVEHLLLALLDNPSAAEVLRTCACNIEDLRKSLQTFVSDKTPVLPQSSEADTQPTLGFKRVVQRAIMHVQSTSNGKNEVTGADVLAAIFGEKDSQAVHYLHQRSVTRVQVDVVNDVLRGITKA